MPAPKPDTSRKIIISVADVYSLFSLVFRDHTNQTYSRLRDEVKQTGICPICSEPLGNRQVQAIHKHGFSREESVRRIVGNRKQINFDYVVAQYEQLHRDQAIIAIGCQKCHADYGTNAENCRRVIPDENFIKTDFLKRNARGKQRRISPAGPLQVVHLERGPTNGNTKSSPNSDSQPPPSTSRPKNRLYTVGKALRNQGDVNNSVSTLCTQEAGVMGILKQSSTQTWNWLSRIKNQLRVQCPTLEYKEAGYWAQFFSAETGRTVAQLNPSKHKIRVLLRLPLDADKSLEQTPATMSWAKQYPTMFQVISDDSIQVAVRVIAAALRRELQH